MDTPAPLRKEASNSASRTTNDGRKITYRLSVIQQPERARACGQGAKSSSDRRPVDPPPIVELRIFEGEESRDITFTHNANFFLFASLEMARPIAHGRVSQPQTNTPVLTGTPVAGVSYLDRPNPAGYFIFPDLSVRHEGQYRLTFNLFEEVKDHKDDDAQSASQNAERPRPHVRGRCDVKSNAFDVFSAKKFPGLIESTILSRVVADQGCRVRIRRDVRVRRRESKRDKDEDWDKYEDAMAGDTGSAIEHHESALVMSPTTADTPGKPSVVPSNTAIMSHSRHPSQQQSSAGADQSAFGMSAQSGSQPNPQSQANGHTQIYSPYGHSPYHQYGQPGYATGANQPMHQYQQYPYAFQPGSVSSTMYGFMPTQQMQQPMHQNPYSQDHMQQYTPQLRQDDMSYPNNVMAQHYQSQTGVPGQVDQGYSRAPPTSTFYSGPHSQPAKSLPPLKTADTSHVKSEVTSPMNAMASNRSEGPTTPLEHARPPPPNFVSSIAGLASKRSFGQAFDTSHVSRPLRDGARPNGEVGHEESDESGDFEDISEITMSYRRADGRVHFVVPRVYGSVSQDGS